MARKQTFVWNPNGSLPGEGYDAGHGLIAVKSASPGGGWGLVTATGWEVISPNSSSLRAGKTPGTRQIGAALQTRQEAFRVAGELGPLAPWDELTRGNRDRLIGEKNQRKIHEIIARAVGDSRPLGPLAVRDPW